MGTIARFHAMFDAHCKARVVCITDMDAVYSEKYFAAIDEFAREGNKCALCFSSLADIPIHGTLLAGAPIGGMPRGHYFRAGLTAVKGKLPLKLWKELGKVVLAKEGHFLGQLRLLDAYKMALNGWFMDVLYEDFEYGYDEIVLNWWMSRVVKAGTVKVVGVVNQNAVWNVKKRIEKTIRWND